VNVAVTVSGSFGGTLISNSSTEVAFIGSWVATASDSNYGGDLLITVPVDDLANLHSIPYSYIGSISVKPDFFGAPDVVIPLNISGSFPFSIL
jgi:hypothetical protein